MNVTKDASVNYYSFDKGIIPIQIFSLDAYKTNQAEWIEIWCNSSGIYLFSCYAITYDWTQEFIIKNNSFIQQVITFDASNVITYSTKCTNFLVLYLQV